MVGENTEAAAAAAAAEESKRKFREYHAKIEALNSSIVDVRYTFRHFEEGGSQDKESVKKLFDLIEERTRLIADFFGGTVTRLAEVPEELNVDLKKNPYLRPDRELESHPKLQAEDQPFLRMDVQGRTYLFFLANTGAVNVYVDGKYKGGNHDMTYYEIFDQLKENSWFGVNG